MPNVFCDLTGNRYGRLVVIDRAENQKKSTRWRCICDCGTMVIAQSANLKFGSKKSCGCLPKGRPRMPHKSPKLHKPRKATEATHERTRRTWASMMYRCGSQLHGKFENYGGRGIAVCERWKEYSNFLEDMGERPDGKSIDRIDNNKGYEPGNCRWATNKEQNANRRDNRNFVCDGKTLNVAQIAELLGKTYSTMYSRLVTRKLTVEQAVQLGSRQNAR